MAAIPGSLRLLTSDEAADLVRESLDLPRTRLEATGSQDQVIAEYVRQAVYDLATVPLRERLSSYVTTITNNVRRQLAPLWPRLERRRDRRPSLREQEAEGDVDPDPIRRVMEALEDLRDIVHLADGYWAPTPTRLVRLSDETALVVGGAATRMLRLEIPAAITLRWIARTARVPDLPNSFRDDPSNWQATSTWLGDPPDNLAAWTAGLFADAKVGQRVSASELSEFDVYRPAANRNRPQAFRWMSVRTSMQAPKGLVFCRAFEGRQFGMRRYWIGSVTRARAGLRADSEYAVLGGSVRRLQYGIDLLERSPTSIEIGAHGSAIDVTLSNPLPPEERRLLVSLGEDHSPRAGKFPLRYRLDQASFAALRPFLDKLGIRLTSA